MGAHLRLGTPLALLLLLQVGVKQGGGKGESGHGVELGSCRRREVAKMHKGMHQGEGSCMKINMSIALFVSSPLL